jgi:hypothetical protein
MCIYGRFSCGGHLVYFEDITSYTMVIPIPMVLQVLDIIELYIVISNVSPHVKPGKLRGRF